MAVQAAPSRCCLASQQSCREQPERQCTTGAPRRQKKHAVLRIALLFFTPSLLACCLLGSLAGARTNLYTATSTELTTAYLCHRAVPIPATLQRHQALHIDAAADAVRGLLFREHPPPATTPRPAPRPLRAGRTYSQCHTLRSHRWGRSDSRFSSSRTAARGGRTAGPGTCSGSAAPGGHRSA